MGLNYELDIDFFKLNEQKVLLKNIKDLMHWRNRSLLDGLIGLLEDVQEQAVETHKVSAAKVFLSSDDVKQPVSSKLLSSPKPLSQKV